MDVPHFSFVGVDVEILQRQAEGVTVCFQILRLDADEIALAGRDEQRATEPINISTGRKRCHPFLILETGTYEPGQRVRTNCPPPCCTNAWRPSERKFRQSGTNVPHHPVHPLLGLWERFHNSDFNYIEFEAIEREAGLNSFVLTPKRWVEQTTY